MSEARIEVFVDEEGGVEKVGLVMRGASIVEYEGDELTPGCTLTAWQARCLANGLSEIADRIDGTGDQGEQESAEAPGLPGCD